MMRETDQDNNHMSKGSNLKPRFNLDKRGRRSEKITDFIRQQPPGLNESELATHLAIQLLRKGTIKPSKVTTRGEETRETVLGNYPAYI